MPRRSREPQPTFFPVPLVVLAVLAAKGAAGGAGAAAGGYGTKQVIHMIKDKRCPECGKYVPKSARMCPECGKYRWADSPETEPTEPPAATAVEPSGPER